LYFIEHRGQTDYRFRDGFKEEELGLILEAKVEFGLVF
jgi:hypothetical protein